MKIVIKPLEWTQQPPPGHDRDTEQTWALTVDGHVMISTRSRGAVLWLASDPFTFVECASIADAQARAQIIHNEALAALIEG